MKPRLRRRQAALRPAMPPPTMTTGNFSVRFGGRKRGAVAEEMADLEGIVDERTGDGAIAFEREADRAALSGCGEILRRPTFND